MRIDSHQYFSRRQDGDRGSPHPGAASPDDESTAGGLRSLLDAGGIDATLLMPATPLEQEAEYLLDLAEGHAWIAGVIGWMDLEAADAVSKVARLARRPGLVGLRPMPQMADRNEINRGVVASAIDAMAMHGLVFDAPVQLGQIDAIHDLAWRHPDLVIVLDQQGAPPTGEGLVAWRAAIARLATRPNVHVRLSGLLSTVPDEAGVRALRPLLDSLIVTFEARRILWGSGWPAIAARASYRDWLMMSERLVEHLPESDHAAIMGGNAVRVYGISPSRNGAASPR